MPRVERTPLRPGESMPSLQLLHARLAPTGKPHADPASPPPGAAEALASHRHQPRRRRLVEEGSLARALQRSPVLALPYLRSGPWLLCRMAPLSGISIRTGLSGRPTGGSREGAPVEVAAPVVDRLAAGSRGQTSAPLRQRTRQSRVYDRAAVQRRAVLELDGEEGQALTKRVEATRRYL